MGSSSLLLRVFLFFHFLLLTMKLTSFLPMAPLASIKSANVFLSSSSSPFFPSPPRVSFFSSIFCVFFIFLLSWAVRVFFAPRGYRQVLYFAVGTLIQCRTWFFALVSWVVLSAFHTLVILGNSFVCERTFDIDGTVQCLIFCLGTQLVSLVHSSLLLRKCFIFFRYIYENHGKGSVSSLHSGNFLDFVVFPLQVFLYFFFCNFM